MDYGKILSRAWQITWRWKILWILGFLAGVGQGIGSSGPQYQMGAEQGGAGGFRIPDEMWAVFAVVGCLAILVGIALWVVSLIARGGLVTGVQQVEDEGATTLGAAWRASAASGRCSASASSPGCRPLSPSSPASSSLDC